MSKLKSFYKRFSSNLRGTDFPIERTVCKGFATPEQTKHYQFLEEYEKNRESFAPEKTDYFKSMIDASGGKTTEFYRLPSDLSIQPTWWIMPWGERVRSAKKMSIPNRADLTDRAKAHAQKLISIYESIKTKGYSRWKGRAIPGYILKHPKHGDIFNYIDGHHRLAVLSLLSNRGIRHIHQVNVLPIATIKRERVLELPTCKKGIKAGHFTEKDALLLFDNAFEAIQERDSSTQL